jgi:hypothetical protein
MPVLAQLDAWAAKQLQVAGSSGAASSWGASNGGEQPGTPAGVDAAAQLGPPKPAATIQLEEGEAEAEAGQWRIQLSSLYFARLAQLLQRHGMALAPPADDVQHVTPTAAGLTLAYSLQKGHSVLTGISDIARLGMMQLCLIRLLGYMAANPLAAGAAAAVSATGGSNGTLLQPNGALTPAGKGAAAPVWPLPGCGSVRLVSASLSHLQLAVAPPPQPQEWQQQRQQGAPVLVTVSWANTLSDDPAPAGGAEAAAAVAAAPAGAGRPAAAQQSQQQPAAQPGNSNRGGSLNHLRCRVSSEPPLPDAVAAALAQQLEAGRQDLFLDSLCLAAHAATAAAQQLAPAAQRAAGLLPGALRWLPASSAGGSALRLRAVLQQGDRSGTLTLSFHAAGCILLQLHAAQPGSGSSATSPTPQAAQAPVWAAQLWQRLQLEVPAFATVQPPAGANGEQRQAVLQAWVPWQGLPLALAHLMRAVAAAK